MLNWKGSNNRPRLPRKKVNWGGETKQAAATTGTVLLKVLTYTLNVFLTVMLIGLITAIIVGAAMIVYIKNYIDPTVDLSLFKKEQSLTTTLYYMDYTDRENRIGEPVELTDQRLYGSQNSIYVEYKNIPRDLINAFVAIEDKRFWDHNGVDLFRTAYAVRGFITGSSTAGGSTITQQLIKNITGDDDVRIQRKIQEIIRAINLEKELTKEQILEMYLNVIYLSQNCYGVQAAANTYFDKDVSELTLAECATLAGITKFPTYYDPIQNPENNLERRNIILYQMLDQGKISQEEYDEASNTELVLFSGSLDEEEEEEEKRVNSWYTDAVIDDVVDGLVELGYSERAAEIMIYTGGLKIYTVMDPDVQNVLEDFYEDPANFPASDSVVQPESSMVVADPYTGDILGLVGGRGEKEQDRLLNRATQSRRPPGSSIKPLSVYAPALEAGVITYSTVYDDVPVMFTGAEGMNQYPKNSPNVYNGLTTIHDAIRRSVNTIAMRTLMDLGVDESYDFLTEELEFHLVDGESYTDRGLAALALGQLNYGLTVREITAGYTMFQNDGVYNGSRTFIEVRDSENNLLIDNSGESKVVLSSNTASLMTLMLKSVVDSGTASGVTLKNSVNVAGKTGTSNEAYDRWFVGYTPYYVGGVWFGYDMPLDLSDFSGNPSANIWNKIMTILHEDILADAASSGEKLRQFELSSGIVSATICRNSGKLYDPNICGHDARGNRAEIGYFTRSTVPTEYCDRHVLVDYCSAGNGIAHAGCHAAGTVTQVALVLEEERSFPKQIAVADAHYMYRELPEGVLYAESSGVPFYQNMLAEGEFVGTSGKFYNAACTTHSQHLPVEPEEPVEDPNDPEDIGGEEDPTAPEDTTAPETTPAPEPTA